MTIPAAVFAPTPLDDRTDAYRFELPESAIAQSPSAQRDHARLLVVHPGGGLDHRRFDALPELLATGDVVVVNDVRVRPARLHARKSTGGRVELLVLQPMAEGRFALVRGSAKIAPGTILRVEGGESDEVVVVGEKTGDGRVVHAPNHDLADLLERHGTMPLPPYIGRAEPLPEDRDRYQTVYAGAGDAAAAPTAGLHFTPELLQRLEARGVGVHRVTLDVGAGTFRPVRTERLTEHPMHAERYRVPPETADAVTEAERRGARIVAVGTTACRSLESWHRLGRPGDGAWRSTRLFLHPGDRPTLPLSLITNFHLPGSTLIALVASFLGRERTLGVYREALKQGYRFYSYGDASILL